MTMFSWLHCAVARASIRKRSSDLARSTRRRNLIATRRPSLSIARGVHDAHAAAAELADQLVLLDARAGRELHRRDRGRRIARDDLRRLQDGERANAIHRRRRLPPIVHLTMLPSIIWVEPRGSCACCARDASHRRRTSVPTARCVPVVSRATSSTAAACSRSRPRRATASRKPMPARSARCPARVARARARRSSAATATSPPARTATARTSAARLQGVRLLRSGGLQCSDSCTFDVSVCKQKNDYCGDGKVNGPELCDGPEIRTCVALGFDAGTASCDLAVRLHDRRLQSLRLEPRVALRPDRVCGRRHRTERSMGVRQRRPRDALRGSVLERRTNRRNRRVRQRVVERQGRHVGDRRRATSFTTTARSGARSRAFPRAVHRRVGHGRAHDVHRDDHRRARVRRHDVDHGRDVHRSAENDARHWPERHLGRDDHRPAHALGRHAWTNKSPAGATIEFLDANAPDDVWAIGWGYDGVELVAPEPPLRPPNNRAIHRPGPRTRTRRDPRRRLQPLRPRRQLPGAFSTGYFTDRYENEWGTRSTSTGGRRPGRATSFSRTTALGRRVPSRRPARGCDPDHLRRLSQHILPRLARREAARERGDDHRRRERAAGDAALRPAKRRLRVDAIWNDDFHHTAMVG